MSRAAASIWFCMVKDEPVMPDQCAYHAPELGCGNVPVFIDGMIWIGERVFTIKEEEYVPTSG